AGSATQNHLTAHEFAVVFAERARKWLVTRVPAIGARRPLPAVSEELLNADTARRCWMQSPGVEQVASRRYVAGDAFPLRFRRQTATSPARKCIGFVKTDVTYG